MFVDAPNIYLYPQEPTATRVQVAQAKNITVSDPTYPKVAGGLWLRRAATPHRGWMEEASFSMR